MKEVFGDKFSRDRDFHRSTHSRCCVCFSSQVSLSFQFINFSIRCKDSKSDSWIVPSICFSFYVMF